MEWHPEEPAVLASGSFDRTVCILDARQSAESAVRVSTGDAGATKGEKKDECSGVLLQWCAVACAAVV